MKTWKIDYFVDSVVVEAETRQEAINKAARIDVSVNFSSCEEVEEDFLDDQPRRIQNET